MKDASNEPPTDLFGGTVTAPTPDTTAARSPFDDGGRQSKKPAHVKARDNRVNMIAQAAVAAGIIAPDAVPAPDAAAAPLAVPPPTGAVMPPDVVALMEKLAAPPRVIVRGEYPFRPGTRLLHVSGPETVWGDAPPPSIGKTQNQGALVGHLYPNGFLLKLIRKEHLLFAPPAIAYDAPIIDAYKGQIKGFAVWVTDTRTWYTVDAGTFYLKRMEINRAKAGRQWALPLPYWRVVQL